MHNLSKQIINAFYHLSYNPRSAYQTLNFVCVFLVTSFFKKNKKHSILCNRRMTSVMASRHHLITITLKGIDVNLKWFLRSTQLILKLHSKDFLNIEISDWNSNHMMVPLPFIDFVFQRYFFKVIIQNQIIILEVKWIDGDWKVVTFISIQKYAYV